MLSKALLKGQPKNSEVAGVFSVGFIVRLGHPCERLDFYTIAVLLPAFLVCRGSKQPNVF